VIGNGPAGFGRGVLEKDPQGHLASTLPRRSPTFFTAGIRLISLATPDAGAARRRFR
jgi:hypothetical protein